MWRGASLLDLRSIIPAVKSTSVTYPRLSLHKERPEQAPPYVATQAELAQATLSCGDNSREIVDYASDGLLEDLVTRGFGSTILTGEIRAAVAVAAIEKLRIESTQKTQSLPPVLNRTKNEQSLEGAQAGSSERKRVDALPVLRILSVGCGSGKIDIPFLEAISKAHLRDGSLLQGRRFEYIGIDPSMRRLTKIATWVEREHPLWENYLGGNPDYPDCDSNTSAGDDNSELDSDGEVGGEDGTKSRRNQGNTAKTLNLSLSAHGLALNKRNTTGGKMTVAQVLASIPRLRSCKDTSFYGLSRFPSLKQIPLSNQSSTISRGKLSLAPLPSTGVSDSLLSTFSMKSGGLLSRTTMNMFDAKNQQRQASKAALLPLLQSDLLDTIPEKAVEKTSCVSLISMSLEDLLESIDKTLSQTSLDAFREASDDVADSGASKADVFATPSHLCVAGSHFDLIFVEHSLYGCRTTSDDKSNQSKEKKKSTKKGEPTRAPLLIQALSSLRTLLRQRGRGIMLIIHRDPASLDAIRSLAAPRIDELALGAFGTPLYSLSLTRDSKYLSKNAALAASDGKLPRSAHATAEESSSIRVETAVMLQHVHADHVQEALQQLCGFVHVESRVLSSHADTTRLCAALEIAMDSVKKSIPVHQQVKDLQPKRLKLRRLTSFLAPVSQPSPFHSEPTPRTPRMRCAHLRKRDIRLLAYLTGVAVAEELEKPLKTVDSDDEEDDGDEALPVIGNAAIPMDRRHKKAPQRLKPDSAVEKLPPLELLLAVDMASVSFDKVLGRIGKVRTIAEMQEQAESNKRKKNAVLLPDRLFIIRSEVDS
jgi:hypothetical protein